VADIIVFHTAWMDEYDDDGASLSAGGFKFAAKHGYGHEAFNFRNIGGFCYGYVPPTGDLHFENHFNVPRGTSQLEGVTVVWTAPHPEQGGRAVVGVWRDATVYREGQDPLPEVARHRRIRNETAGYRATAAAENCVLLPPPARPIFFAARQKRDGESWPGEKAVFYPKPGSAALQRLNAIIKEIGSGLSGSGQSQSGRTKKKRSSWQADIEKRQRVEKAAIEAVGSQLEAAHFAVESVEKDNLGYDLLATRGDEILYVEVKGRSGSDATADLSVNEFDCLTRYARERDPKGHYRVAIVTDALGKPVIHEFVLVRGESRRDATWSTLDGRWRLDFEERTAARLIARRSD
jgi:hypothetical protein